MVPRSHWLCATVKAPVSYQTTSNHSCTPYKEQGIKWFSLCVLDSLVPVWQCQSMITFNITRDLVCWRNGGRQSLKAERWLKWSVHRARAVNAVTSWRGIHIFSCKESIYSGRHHHLPQAFLIINSQCKINIPLSISTDSKASRLNIVKTVSNATTLYYSFKSPLNLLSLSFS